MAAPDLRTLSCPVIGSAQPTVVASSTDMPRLVTVEVVAGNPGSFAYLALASADLNTMGPGDIISSAYRLPIGEPRTFRLEKGQRLYVGGSATGMAVSYHAYDAPDLEAHLAQVEYGLRLLVEYLRCSMP